MRYFTKRRKTVKIILVLSFVINLITNTIVYSHPGRTDANGGHWDRSTGIYHYHDGQYAGRSSSGSNSTSTYYPFKPPYSPTPRTTPKGTKSSNLKNSSSNDDKSKIGGFFGLFISFCFFIVGPVLSICIIIYESFICYHLPYYKLNDYESSILNLDEQLKKIIIIKNLLSTYESSILIPENYEIGNDNLPKEKSSNDWGKNFTYYTSARGKKIHQKYGCCNSYTKHNVYEIYHNNKLPALLCKKCCKNYHLPDLSWYEIYLKSKNLSVQYERCLENVELLKNKVISQNKKCNSKFTKTLLVFNKKNKQKLNTLNQDFNRIIELINH